MAAQLFDTSPARFILRDQMDPGANGLLNLSAALFQEGGAAKQREAELEMARLLAGRGGGRQQAAPEAPPLFDRRRVPAGDIERVTTQQVRDDDPMSPTFGRMIDVPLPDDEAFRERIRAGIHPTRQVPLTAKEANEIFNTDPRFRELNEAVEVDLGPESPSAPPPLFGAPPPLAALPGPGGQAETAAAAPVQPMPPALFADDRQQAAPGGGTPDLFAAAAPVRGAGQAVPERSQLAILDVLQRQPSNEGVAAPAEDLRGADVLMAMGADPAQAPQAVAGLRDLGIQPLAANQARALAQRLVESGREEPRTAELAGTVLALAGTPDDYLAGDWGLLFSGDPQAIARGLGAVPPEVAERYALALEIMAAQGLIPEPGGG